MSERRKVAAGRGGWPAIVLANRIFQNRRRRRLFHWVAWHFCNGAFCFFHPAASFSPPLLPFFPRRLDQVLIGLPQPGN